MPREIIKPSPERGTAVADEEESTTGEQGNMFPDLDMRNATHKTILRTAKAFYKAKAERDEVLTTAKEKMDGFKGKLISLMHEAKIDRFKHNDVKVTLVPAKENVQVKIDGDESVDVDADE